MTDKPKPKKRIQQRYPMQVQFGPDGHRADIFRDADGVPRCNSRKRNTDDRCKAQPVRGSKRCRHHGGLSPRGPASPQWKHGEQSSWRTHLGVKVGSGDEYLNLREGIEAQAEVLRRVAERLAVDDSPSFRVEAQRRFAVCDSTFKSGNAASFKVAMEDMRAWLDSGVRADSELRRMSDVAARLSTQVEGAHRARASALNSMNQADALAWVISVVNIIEKEVGSGPAQRVFARVNREVLSHGATVSPPEDRGRDEPRVVEASSGEVAP